MIKLNKNQIIDLAAGLKKKKAPSNPYPFFYNYDKYGKVNLIWANYNLHDENHEIWKKCQYCNEVNDLRKSPYCDNCGKKINYYPNHFQNKIVQ